MFEQLGLEGWTPVGASLALGIALGIAYGAAAERSRFCLRRGLAGPAEERRSALGVWALALAVAVLGTQAAAALGWIGFAEHRFTAARIPVLAILTGGIAFGAGMVLTRGCASRITVLAASGNLRSALCLAVFGLTALATLRGALAPVRDRLSAPVVDASVLSDPANWPGGAMPWAVALAALLTVFALRSGAARRDLALGVLIGLLVPLAWVGTGLVLQDDFDPIPMQALTFTASTMDAVFWFTAATAVAPGFGAGLFAGTLIGAATAALAGRRFEWQGFNGPAQTGRYMAGAVLMGMGGVLAGGCTVGAGLSGVPTLGLSAVLALVAIAAGALAMARVVDRAPD
jgi:uncharacterized membrane protein YedE/YeeE